jgi:hypothetical protein
MNRTRRYKIYWMAVKRPYGKLEGFVSDELTDEDSSLTLSYIKKHLEEKARRLKLIPFGEMGKFIYEIR